MVTLNLWSRKNGELKRFLNSYYEDEIMMEDEAAEWVHVYRKPLEAVDMISAVMDNLDKYQIMVCIQVNEGQLYHVTADNHNDVIRGIYHLYYNESTLVLH